MRKFRYDTKGAVTVIVSIMLIPALLLSGTAVDLARIHAAKSAAQNANQLAANAVLSQYHALLKDLYGLFGVAEHDPILGDMIDEYIQVAVLGQKSDDDWIDTGLGTFQVFNGSDASAEVEIADDYNLGNYDVLRRQIEEYMKFRGPVILVEQLLKSFETHGSSIKSSYEAIEQQEVVSDLMIDFISMYVDLYDAIAAADQCRETGATPDLAGDMVKLTKSLEQIKEDFKELEQIQEEWEEVCEEIEEVIEELEAERDNDPQDHELIEELEDELDSLRARKILLENNYKQRLGHIETVARGGGGFVALEQIAADAKEHAIKFKENFQKVVDVAASLDSKREDIRKEISALQQKINDPSCDATLKKEMQEIIKECTALLNEFPNLEGLAKTYQENGDRYIDDVYIPMLEDIKYRDDGNSGRGSLSISELENIASNSALAISGNGAARYAGFANVGYKMPDGFKKFEELQGDHKRLYDKLHAMANENYQFEPVSIDGLKDKSGSKDAGTRQRDILQQLTKLADDAKNGLTNNPLGAERINDSTVQNAPSRTFNMGNNVIDMLSDPAGAIQGMADYTLVLTYATSMFSNYTTGKPAELGGGGGAVKTSPAESITSVPMSPKVNYFYQSEWEYLLIGDKDADKNLSAVKNLIYAIRIVCNTIAAFSIPEVKETATLVRSAVSLIPYVGPPLGVILYFATFAAFAAAESTVDLMALRNGCKVPLIKNNSTWIMKPSGIVEKLANLGKDGDISVESAGEHANEKGISYEQYMLSFFIVDALVYGKSIDTLVDRMGNLIEWNVINYESKANANSMDGNGKVDTARAAGAMSAAFAQADCFRLVKMHTDFNVTTTIDLRLMFLPMPMFKAQGSPFANEYPVTETDYRGY